MLVPIVKLLKPTLSTPSVFGERHDARRAGAGDEALRRETGADAADGFTEVDRIAQIAEAEFVDGSVPKFFVSPRLSN